MNSIVVEKRLVECNKLQSNGLLKLILRKRYSSHGVSSKFKSDYT